MKTIILYDSNYGNTSQIAKAITGAIPEATSIEVSNASAKILNNVDVLIVGSPTNGGRPTEDLQDFISQLSDNSLQGVQVAAFDTRFALTEHGLGLKMVMKTIGFAAEKIAKSLVGMGGAQIANPEGFIVTDREGPLLAGELERAESWARQINSSTHVPA